MFVNKIFGLRKDLCAVVYNLYIYIIKLFRYSYVRYKCVFYRKLEDVSQKQKTSKCVFYRKLEDMYFVENQKMCILQKTRRCVFYKKTRRCVFYRKLEDMYSIENQKICILQKTRRCVFYRKLGNVKIQKCLFGTVFVSNII